MTVGPAGGALGRRKLTAAVRVAVEARITLEELLAAGTASPADFEWLVSLSPPLSLYIYIYIYIYMCVCVSYERGTPVIGAVSYERGTPATGADAARVGLLAGLDPEHGRQGHASHLPGTPTTRKLPGTPTTRKSGLNCFVCAIFTRWPRSGARSARTRLSRAR